MMAALTAAQGGASVALLERNPKLGRKLYITGKGRCNVTNHCSVQEVLDSTPRNSRFLYGAVTRTPPAWVEDFFRQEGVPLKVERGNRVFPESDRAADIIDALFHALRRSRVRVIQDRARHILVEDMPGTGKTTMALAFSRAMGLKEKRVLHIHLTVLMSLEQLVQSH